MRKKKTVNYEATCPKCKAEYFPVEGPCRFCMTCGTKLVPKKV